MTVPFYKQAARFYDRIWYNFTKATLSQTLTTIDFEQLKAQSNSPQLLDIGCGTGEFEVRLSRLHPEIAVTALDSSEEMLEQARNKLYGDCRITFQKADANQPLPFHDNSFDGVVSNNVLHYFKAPSKTLTEIRRVLKSGGQLVIEDYTVHGQAWPVFEQLIKVADSLHQKTYTLAELCQMLQNAGFDIKSKGDFNIDRTWHGMIVQAVKP